MTKVHSTWTSTRSSLWCNPRRGVHIYILQLNHFHTICKRKRETRDASSHSRVPCITMLIGRLVYTLSLGFIYDGILDSFSVLEPRTNPEERLMDFVDVLEAPSAMQLRFVQWSLNDNKVIVNN